MNSAFVVFMGKAAQDGVLEQQETSLGIFTSPL
jgi:hypothetical protein